MQMRFRYLAIFYLLLFPLTLTAQMPSNELLSGEAVQAALNDEKPQQFTVELKANQTARIEVVYQGYELTVSGIGPDGERIVTVESPTGIIGSRILLLTAEADGTYKIDVARTTLLNLVPIAFTIEVKEIRETDENDMRINSTRNKIQELIALEKNPAQAETIKEHTDAIAKRRAVIELSRVIDDKYLEARSSLLLGSRYQSMGENQQALEEWLNARALYKDLKRTDLEAMPVFTIGVIYSTIGEYDTAIEYYAEAERLFGPTSFPLINAAILGAYSSAYSQKNQNQKAVEAAEEALAIYSAGKVRLGEMIIYGLLGSIYTETNQTQLAIDSLEKALAMADEFPQAQGTADLQIKLGTLYWKTGKTEKGKELLLKGSALASRVGQNNLVVESVYQLARVENELGNLNGSIGYLVQGIELAERIRSGLTDKGNRASYFSTIQRIYELYADLLIQRSRKNNDPADIARAFEVSERSRARSLRDLLEEARLDFRIGVDPLLLQRETDVANALKAALQSRVGLVDDPAQQELLDRIDAQVEKLQAESESLNVRIRQESPRYANLTRGTLLTANDIQNLLDDDTVLLEYKLGEERSYLWLVSNKKLEYFDLPKGEEIETIARSYYELTVANNTEDLAEGENLSKQLNKILLSKVAPSLKGKRVAIVADGILQYLPFSTLLDKNSTYLADRNETVMLPSAAVLAEIRLAKSGEPGKTMAVFADPVFDADDSRIEARPDIQSADQKKLIDKRLRAFNVEELPRLLASREEARNITAFSDQASAIVNTGFDANLKTVRDPGLADYRIVHFATHGLLNTAKPELSGLVFSLYDKAGNPEDGFLGLNDIYNLNLASDMVVLSACQTALGKDVKGEGLVGISRGFLYAGSKRVVASLWKVDDSATAEFMKLFYRNHLQKGMPASTALQAARLEMKKIRRYESPYYWGAFTILGDWQ